LTNKLFLGRYQCFLFFIADTDIFVLLNQHLFCLMRQNKHSWRYFAFSQKFSNYSWKTLQCILFFRPHKQRK